MSGAGRVDASIVVATTRDGARLARALDALRAATADVAYELIVVLNGADADVAAVAESRDDVSAVVPSDVNLGFAGASNLGRAHAGGEFLVLLHDDAFPQPGWLGRLLRTARERPAAGVVGPLVLRPDGRINVAGPVLFADGASWGVGAGAEPGDPRYAEPRLTDYCAGNSVMVRASAWDAFGGLEEALFPAGYIDVDLAFRARRAGWEVWFEPRAAVIHESGGGSLSPGFRTWVYQRNRDIFTAKWADELTGHEPFDAADAEGSAARAVARAARRVPVAGPPRKAHVGPSRELDLLHEYVRELDAWAATVHREWPLLAAERDSLRAALGDARTELEASIERSGELAATIATLDAECARLRAREAELDAECSRLLEREAALEAEHTRLRAREDVLDAILAGRWWKLRGRLRRLGAWR